MYNMYGVSINMTTGHGGEFNWILLILIDHLFANRFSILHLQNEIIKLNKIAIRSSLKLELRINEWECLVEPHLLITTYFHALLKNRVCTIAHYFIIIICNASVSSKRFPSRPLQNLLLLSRWNKVSRSGFYCSTKIKTRR